MERGAVAPRTSGGAATANDNTRTTAPAGGKRASTGRPPTPRRVAPLIALHPVQPLAFPVSLRFVVHAFGFGTSVADAVLDGPLRRFLPGLLLFHAPEIDDLCHTRTLARTRGTRSMGETVGLTAADGHRLHAYRAGPERVRAAYVPRANAGSAE